MTRLYLSYSRQDQAAADTFQAALAAKGYTLAELSPASGGWRAAAQAALEAADVVVALISPDYVESRMAMEELAQALAAQTPIVPVLVRRAAVPEALLSYQIIDATDDVAGATAPVLLAVEASVDLLALRRAMARVTGVMPAVAAQPAARRRQTPVLLIAGVVIVVVVGAGLVLLSVSGPAVGNIFSNISGSLDVETRTAQEPLETALATATPIEVLEIVIAVQDIPQGMVIPPDAVGLRSFPEAYAPMQALLRLEDVIGRVARTDIYREQIILSNLVELPADASATASSTANAAVLTQTAAARTTDDAPTDNDSPTEGLAPDPVEATGTPTRTTSPEIAEIAATATALANIIFRIPTAQTPTASLLPDTGGGKGIDVDAMIDQSVAGTVIARGDAGLRAVGTLARLQATQAVALNLLIDRTPNTTLVVTVGVVAAAALGVLAAVVTGAALGGRRRPLSRRTGHGGAHGRAHETADTGGGLPEPMLQEFDMFISSSDRDKQWVNGLVDDLVDLGYLVWWYAKDAPGLPFGNEIRSAIYHTKIFVVILSPDSMKSKHVEEEIRWAEIYNRPILPVLCRAIAVEERLYGLAKGADIDFTEDADYRAALELLTQAIDHYLQQRLTQLQQG